MNEQGFANYSENPADDRQSADSEKFSSDSHRFSTRLFLVGNYIF